MKIVVNKMPGKSIFFKKSQTRIYSNSLRKGIKKGRIAVIVPYILLFFIVSAASGQQQIEDLNRGVVAVRKTDTSIFVGWRLLATDPDTVGFNVYRGSLKVNDSIITNSTNFIDHGGSVSDLYHVKPILGGLEQEASDTAVVWGQRYIVVPLQRPAGGTTPDAVSYSYSPNDASAGDLDGDGEYEIVLKWDPSNSKDNSQSGYTGNVFLDACKIDGTHLWRIDLGKNIRAGAHYTQFMVYDLDGDGKAELACKTAPGTRDGSGSYLSLGPAAGADHEADYRNSSGYILSGPEYFTIFDGETGNELATTDYIPPRGNVSSWGDSYGNRVDRFLACIAYLDGERPSVVMCRGYYTRTVLAAWDWRGGTLTHRWTFDSNIGYSSYAGQGNHNLSVGDVDGDGKDEIVYGSCAIDDDGTGLWNSGLGHGDAMHLSDMDPDRPGLEVWGIHENAQVGSALLNARTGAIIWGTGPADVGRGVSGDLVASHFGMECWGGTDGLRSSRNIRVGSYPSSQNHVVWWNGDLNRELLDANHIDKYSGAQLLYASGCSSNNGSKSNPCLQADILGDWREEVIWRTDDNTALRIYTTFDLTDYRITTLMHDHVYRLGIAWQNVAYNQPPHTGFYLGVDMFLADSLRPPASPLNVTAKAWSDTVELHWDKNFDVDLAGYRVYRSKSFDGPFDTLTADVIVDNFYIDTDVINDTAYYYAITAVDSFDNESRFSEKIMAIPTIRPDVPDGFYARTDLYAVKLFWNTVNGDNVAGYNIYRSTSSGKGYSLLNAELISDTSYLDPNRYGCPVNYYVVASVDTGLTESFYSAEVVAHPCTTYTIQAEDAVLGGTYYLESEHFGFHGTGYVNFESSGTSVDFTNLGGFVGRPVTLVFRYALGNVNRTGSLVVNGVTRSLTMKNTGAWTNYAKDSLAITLNDGFDNSIRFQSTGSDFGNLDEITIRYGSFSDIPEIYSYRVHGEIELFQNIPNPFSDNTRIVFNVNKHCKVSLDICNIMGQPVRTLFSNVPYEPGMHEVTWNASDNNGERIPAGIYLYRIRTNTNSYIIKKLLYIKDN